MNIERGKLFGRVIRLGTALAIAGSSVGAVGYTAEKKPSDPVRRVGGGVVEGMYLPGMEEGTIKVSYNGDGDLVIVYASGYVRPFGNGELPDGSKIRIYYHMLGGKKPDYASQWVLMSSDGNDMLASGKVGFFSSDDGTSR